MKWKVQVWLRKRQDIQIIRGSLNDIINGLLPLDFVDFTIITGPNPPQYWKDLITRKLLERSFAEKVK